MTRAPTREAATPATSDIDPAQAHALLVRAVEEAARLLDADGAMVYLVDRGRMRFAVDAGIRNREAQRLIRGLSLPVGVGLFGHAVASGEVVVSGDYAHDDRFEHSDVADRIVAIANMRSMAAAPLIAEGEVLGALGAYSSRTDDFDEAEVALLRALADHAATAIANQRLIERLARSQEELARRVEAQRTLAQITASIAAIRGLDDVLHEVVDAARRLLGSDGAHLTLMDDSGEFLRPSVVVGGNAAWTEEWLHDLEFPVNGGINGLAAGTREVIWTEDYLVDPRIPHAESDQSVAERLGLRGMASVPLRGPEGHVIGTLAVSFDEVHRFSADELELLGGLADQGAIAIANARLLEKLSSSEGRFRHLVTSSPDLVWETDVEGRFTFLSPRLAELAGWEPGELIGQSWPAIVAEESMPEAVATWEGLRSEPSIVRKIRFMLRRRDAGPIPAEVYAIGSERDGVFAGAHGSIRDLTSSEQLMERLREQADELARRVDAQRTLAGMAAQLTSLRDPSAVLEQTLIAAVRLLKGNGGQIGMIERDEDDVLRWGDGHSLVHGELVPFTKADHTPVDEGVSGRAVRELRATWTEDYLADRSFPHDRNSDRIARRLGIRAVIAAPLVADDEPIGAIGVYAEQPGAYDADSGELLRLLADQAAIVLTNARLYAEAEVAAEKLAHRVEAQRSLGAIAAAITSLRDPVAVLDRTVAETKRLLNAEHVVIHQVRAGTRELAEYRQVISAGSDGPFDEVTVSIGQGIAGRAIETRSVSRTDDYLADRSFEHTALADSWITRHGFVSQISAPLIGEEGAMGAITAYSSRRAAFDEDDAQLIGALASQAAIVLGNARLYEELERRVEAQRSLGEIAARITAIRDPGDVLQRTLDEAVRLLDADGGRIELVAETGGLHWAFGHSAIDLPIERDEEVDPVQLDEGVSGRAVRERRVVRTGDYLADPSFSHAEAPDRYIRQHGIRSVMSAPLIGEDGAIGSLTVHSQTRNAFDAANEELLEVLASQAAIAVTNARLYDELGEESAALARLADSQQRLLQINERLLRTLDPASVLDLIAEGLKSVVWYDNFSIYRVDDDMRVLNPVLARDRNARAVLDFPIERGRGLTWWSVEHREPVLINDALHDDRVIQIPGTEEEEEAMIIVPLISGDEVIGAMNIARTGGAEVAFTDADFELVQLFAGQAAVAITNARLVEQLRTRVDAQRSLAEIAAQIASLHEPQTVLDRAVADAARLLGADRAQINLLGESSTHLDPPITAAPIPPSDEDVPVPIGSGVAGIAAAEKRVCWTGDYLADQAFPHDEGDRWIDAQHIHSMMSAPLLGPDRLIGTITVQSTEANAFDEQDAELLKLLADQAAIALTNARLYAQLEESERRYRHLVDNSPDIVWEVDAEGRFTFFSDSLEERTGWRAEQLIGQPFTVLAGATSLAEATEAWRVLRAEPNREQRVRLDLPLPDGRVAKTEVAMTGTILDGRFMGAHGSVRDISERERLEGDLRDQAAELAASQERAHLARELHDSVTQVLFSMGLTLRALEILLGTDPQAAGEKLTELRELQQDALAEMRTLIFELRPSSLESDGLVQALRTHATAVQRRTGLAIVVDAEPIDRLPLAAEEALYRIGQEALHNVVKHANASHATIRIWRDGNTVRLSVTDDGGGFDPDAVPRGHLGLIGMRQRVDLVGGELRVDSRPGKGTLIEAAVPGLAE